jgi:hypothetical protein
MTKGETVFFSMGHDVSLTGISTQDLMERKSEVNVIYY